MSAAAGLLAPRDLAVLVAAAGAVLVAPKRPRSAPGDVLLPLSLVDACALGGTAYVAVVSDASGSRWTVPLVVVDGTLRRAVAGDGVAAALVAAGSQALEEAFELRPGEPPQSRQPSRSVMSAASVDRHAERAIVVDQTNESIAVGESVVVKWQLALPLMLDDADHPAIRRLDTLSGQQFPGVPRLWSMLIWHDGDRTRLLATVSDYIPDARDGWDWAVDDVRAVARGSSPMPTALEPVHEIARLIAGMHVALAAGGVGTASADDARDWHQQALDDLAAALALVEGAEGERLAARAARITTGLAPLADAAGTLVLDVHGDLHVGQVLRHGDPASYSVVDFDGNPVLTPSERARSAAAARDVAGMLASLDHVGRVVLHRTDNLGSPGRALVTDWILQAQQAFLETYRRELAAAGHGHLLDERLVTPMRLQQECRELLYAVRHLPHWRYVPDGALQALLPEEG